MASSLNAALELVAQAGWVGSRYLLVVSVILKQTNKQKMILNTVKSLLQHPMDTEFSIVCKCHVFSYGSTNVANVQIYNLLSTLNK